MAALSGFSLYNVREAVFLPAGFGTIKRSHLARLDASRVHAFEPFAGRQFVGGNAEAEVRAGRLPPEL